MFRRLIKWVVKEVKDTHNIYLCYKHGHIPNTENERYIRELLEYEQGGLVPSVWCKRCGEFLDIYR